MVLEKQLQPMPEAMAIVAHPHPRDQIPGTWQLACTYNCIAVTPPAYSLTFGHHIQRHLSGGRTGAEVEIQDLQYCTLSHLLPSPGLYFSPSTTVATEKYLLKSYTMGSYASTVAQSSTFSQHSALHRLCCALLTVVLFSKLCLSFLL